MKSVCYAQKIKSPVSKTMKHLYRQRFKYATLGLLATFSAILAGAYQSVKNQEKISCAIGKSIGDKIEAQQKMEKQLNQITQKASSERKEYQQSCKKMAFIINELQKYHPNFSVENLIDKACEKFNIENENKQQTPIIIEDIQTIKKFFTGSSKDLRNVMCYYHSSPEIKFHNRYSEPYSVKFAIDAYERKVHDFLHPMEYITRESMFERERDK